MEQHFWGEFGLWPYTSDEYVSAGDDPQVKNGSYVGVSWWWRPVAVPASFAGKAVILHVRGARQRAEVYLNRKTVPFQCMSPMHPAVRARQLANALLFLAATAPKGVH